MEAEQPQAGSDADASQAEAAFGQMFFPEEEPAQTQAAPEEEQQAEPQAQTTEQPVAESDGFEEFEFEGERLRGPKKLKESLLRHDDYTKKTQETAHLRAVAAVEAQTYQASQQFDAHTANEREELAYLTTAIKQYKSVDLTSLDDGEYSRAKRNLDALKERSAELQTSLKEKRTQFDNWLASEKQKATRAAYEFVEKKIPGFTPNGETEKALGAYLQSSTVPADVFAYLARQAPEVVVWAHKAAQYDKLQASKNTVLAQVKTAPPVVKPGANDPAMQAKMQELSELKALKGAKDRGSQMQYAEKVLGRFFERN